MIDCSWSNRSNRKSVDGNEQCASREADVIEIHGYRYARNFVVDSALRSDDHVSRSLPHVMCGNLACACNKNFYTWPHIPLFLLRVSGKRSCHAKVHNNRGVAAISYPTITTNRKSFAEAVEFFSHDSHSLNFLRNFEHSDGQSE